MWIYQMTYQYYAYYYQADGDGALLLSDTVKNNSTLKVTDKSKLKKSEKYKLFMIPE